MVILLRKYKKKSPRRGSLHFAFRLFLSGCSKETLTQSNPETSRAQLFGYRKITTIQSPIHAFTCFFYILSCLPARSELMLFAVLNQGNILLHRLVFFGICNCKGSKKYDNQNKKQEKKGGIHLPPTVNSLGSDPSKRLINLY